MNDFLFAYPVSVCYRSIMRAHPHSQKVFANTSVADPEIAMIQNLGRCPSREGRSEFKGQRPREDGR